MLLISGLSHHKLINMRCDENLDIGTVGNSCQSTAKSRNSKFLLNAQIST